MAHEILLYDEIGPEAYGLLGGKWLIDELGKAGGKDVALRINSPGGSVFEGQAMYNALARYPGKVTAYVDSLSASAASFVMLAASKIVVAQNAMVMIHNAWGLTIGNAAAMRQSAELLDKVDKTIVDTYAARTKQDTAAIAEMMAAETWMTASEAVAKGFADEIGQKLAVKACVRDGMFNKTPAELLTPADTVSPRVAAASIARRLAMARALDTARG